MKSPSQNTELTQDEAELYDRQIRLWGVESQKRLRCSRVLIIGVRGYGCEIAKNIILSGVKSVTLLDSGVVNEEDTCAQFMAPRDHRGKNVAQSSLAQAQKLNPMVQVSADCQNVSEKPDSFFADFDVICATKCPTPQLIRIDRLCQASKILFFCGDVFGMFGYLFADLGHHSFEREKTIYKPRNKNKPVESGDADKKGDTEDKVTVMVQETSSFVLLEDALNVDWKTEGNVERLKKMDLSYFLMKVLLRFRAEHGRDPSPYTRAQDLALLDDLRVKELAQLGVPATMLPDPIHLNLFSEVAPVCAILGGVMAQEIIKAVSKREAPHNNFFFFNPVRNLGFIERVGPQ